MFQFRRNNADSTPQNVKFSEEKFNKLFDELNCYELSILIGSDIIPFVDKIGDEIWVLRTTIKEKNGFIIPLVKIQDDSNIQENEFIIKIRNNTIHNGFVIPTEQESVKEIIESLEKICTENIESVFSMSLLNKYIDVVRNNNKWLADDVYWCYTISDIKYVLVYLLNHNYSIKNINFIFEKMCEFVSVERYNFRNIKKVARFVSEELCCNK